MTRLDQLYDRLLDEVPQLKSYLHRDAKGEIIAGPRWKYFEAPVYNGDLRHAWRGTGVVTGGI